MDRKIIIRYDRCKCVLILRLPYNESCLVDLKNDIPKGSRIWDPDLGVWFIAPFHINRLIKIIRKHFNVNEIFVNPNIPRHREIIGMSKKKQVPKGEKQNHDLIRENSTKGV